MAVATGLPGLRRSEEELGAELHPDPLSHADRLEYREVPVMNARASEVRIGAGLVAKTER